MAQQGTSTRCIVHTRLLNFNLERYRDYVKLGFHKQKGLPKETIRLLPYLVLLNATIRNYDKLHCLMSTALPSNWGLRGMLYTFFGRSGLTEAAVAEAQNHNAILVNLKNWERASR